MTDIPSDLAAAGKLAGMHDVSDLALLDLANLPRDGAGRVLGARDVVEQLRRDHPALFLAPKNARDMTPSERQAAIRNADRAAYAKPIELPHAGKRIQDMSLKEQQEFTRAYHQKFPEQARFLSIPRRSPYKV